MFSHPTYLDFYLAPLRRYFEQADVTDIYINQPEEIWVEKLSGHAQRFHEPALHEASLWRLARQVANYSHQGVSRRHPLLAAQLPDGSRIQIATPPATQGGMAIAIRRHIAAVHGLEDYMPSRGAAVQDFGLDLTQLAAERDWPSLLVEAVRQRRNILISGGTSAGKTTLLNSLLTNIAPNERLIYIEDTPELRRSHKNSIGFVAVRGGQGEAEVSMTDLLHAALRMRPDRIILGELRGEEAFTFLRAINTGHPGSMATIHADSPDRALIQLAMMILQAGLGLAYSDVIELIRSMVDVIVQMECQNGHRVITEITVRH